jgi:uncharacterized protein YceK
MKNFIFHNTLLRWLIDQKNPFPTGQKVLIVFIFLWILVFLSGCSAIISSTTSRLADNFSYAFANNTDTTVVEEAAPAYLLMMDALIKDDPENVSLLRNAAGLNVSYATIFVKDIERSRLITEKALHLSLRAACLDSRKLCGIREKNYDDFKKVIDSCSKAEIAAIFSLGEVWASWIQAHQNDWYAVAELPRVEAIMEQVVKLDSGYENGSAFLYLGTLATLLPPALGGNPEKGREFFEKAIEISAGKNLYAKVLYAERYARLVFDKQLHDRLLQEVFDADPVAEGYTLINLIAQKEAKRLLSTSDEYF